MHSMTFKIRGLDCAEEVAVLQRAVGPVVGGEAHLAFDILNGTMTVGPGAGDGQRGGGTAGRRAHRDAGAALAGGQRDSTRRDGLAAPWAHRPLHRQRVPPC